ncbi:HEAT repeat domain-containing protein [Akkermansiaceae bacterium]|nr:HEAT repeat domain-containing protein [Akkermansiaceae bacterium]
MKSLAFSAALLTAILALPAAAEERTHTQEEMDALLRDGDLGAEEVERPANLPDLTKGELIPPAKKKEPKPWYYGPTGIVGLMVGDFVGDQIQVQSTLNGSPAHGKFMWGDVITGMNGKKFEPGGHLGILIGNAIIEAEKEENGGKITFQVWRDKNYAARFGKQDVAGVDVDKLFDEVRDDNSLYDWKPEEERTKEVTKLGFDKFPIVPETFEVELKLRTMPAYSDTAPYDCPKTQQILEDAWKVLEKKFVADPKDPRSGKGGIIEAMALVASGKPEHRKIVHDWVRGPNSPWRPPTEPPGAMFEPGYKGYKGYQSWHHGFGGLYCALYYDATGDDFVLPALRKYAIDTAMGQSGGGSWGHTFAYPSFNGGELHRMNPGYGALNAAGNRCFFLITLAQKLGIKDPEIDAAVIRAQKFFSSFIDQGALPYGDHGAAGTDDSNGKNTGIAFSLKLLGDKYGAKYFSQMSTHASFTPRGGHAHDYHTQWSAWGATLCGPEGRIAAERNMRWSRTLARMFDGSFVYHSPGGYSALRDPTATQVFNQAVIYKQTLITGKDEDKELWTTEREMKQLLTSARGQLNDPALIARSGKPWQERSTDEIFDLLDIFFPKARGAYADELGKRYQAGEKEILPRLVELLGSDEPRLREGACRGLLACGNDAVLENLSKLTKLLDDPKDFVRISAVNVISKSTETEETQLAMLEATAAPQQAVAPNSVRNATQVPLFGDDSPLAKSPFEAGFDEDLVYRALEKLIELDPVGKGFIASRNGVWDKETVVRLAGPLTFAAEEEQIGDQMFANRAAPARELLRKFGYREAYEASAHLLRKKAGVPRDIRAKVTFKDPLIDPPIVLGSPGAFRDFAGFLRTVLTDDPNLSVTTKDERNKWVEVTTNLDTLLARIEAAKPVPNLPSIADEAGSFFRKNLDAADGTGAKLKLCRATLADPDRKDYFRKMAAMDYLAETLGPDALEDFAPYLSHPYWRLREHSRKLAPGLVAGSGNLLNDLFAKTKDPRAASGILDTLALCKVESGLSTAKQAMSHEEPLVRQSAIRATMALGGNAVIPEVVAHLKASTSKEDLRGCEEALDPLIGDPAFDAALRDALIAMLPDAEPSARPIAYYLIARIGDAPSIDVLKKAAQTDSLTEFEEICYALSYSPSRAADKLMLELAATDKRSAEIVGAHSVRRMVIGPKGYGDVTVAEKMDFAEAMLKLALDRQLITQLSHIPEARAMRALMFCLEKGVESAAGNLITCAEGMGKLSPADSEIAAKALQDVIEYIEVTRLRGGIQAHMSKDDKYVEWKELQARAGKVLLRIHKPGEAPIPEFDTLEFE